MEDAGSDGYVRIGLKSGRSFVIRGSLPEVRDRIMKSDSRLEEFELQSRAGALVYIAPDAVDSISELT